MSHRHSNGPKEGQMSGGVVGDCLWCSNGGDPTADTPAGRIRELEAELEHSRQAAMSELAQIQNEFFREKARAEKAEACQFSDAEEILRLKARVAELEKDWETWS